MAQLGDSYGEYRLDKLLGKGGFAHVYAATHSTKRSEVAIKILNSEWEENRAILDRFFREAMAARDVGEGVVQIIDFRLMPKPHMIMELVRGPTLLKHLADNGDKLDLPWAVEIARQIADIMARVHSKGIVHRDLKPENIFVVAKQIRISDFGICALLDAPVTRAGHRFGTPAYWSPEQADGKKADHRSDIYTLGVILYEMCVGSRPDRPVDRAVLETADWPPPLAELASEMLSKDPSRRPSSMAECVSRLSACALELSRRAQQRERKDQVNKWERLRAALSEGVDKIVAELSSNEAPGKDLEHELRVLRSTASPPNAVRSVASSLLKNEAISLRLVDAEDFRRRAEAKADASATELVAAQVAIRSLEGEVIRLRKQLKRARLVAAGLGAALVLLLSVVVAYRMTNNPSRDSRAPEVAKSDVPRDAADLDALPIVDAPSRSAIDVRARQDASVRDAAMEPRVPPHVNGPSDVWKTSRLTGFLWHQDAYSDPWPGTVPVAIKQVSGKYYVAFEGWWRHFGSSGDATCDVQFDAAGAFLNMSNCRVNGTMKPTSPAFVCDPLDSPSKRICCRAQYQLDDDFFVTAICYNR